MVFLHTLLCCSVVLSLFHGIGVVQNTTDGWYCTGTGMVAKVVHGVAGMEHMPWASDKSSMSEVGDNNASSQEQS